MYSLSGTFNLYNSRILKPWNFQQGQAIYWKYKNGIFFGQTIFKDDISTLQSVTPKDQMCTNFMIT